MTTEVTHDEAEARYFIALDDKQVGSIAYRLVGDTVHIDSTFVNPAVRGKMLAAELTRKALEDIRARGLKVVPHCSYTVKYIELHPETHDLLAR
jgi:predicted GNAT family acetyltransferase